MTLAELVKRCRAAWIILRKGLQVPKPAKRAEERLAQARERAVAAAPEDSGDHHARACTTPKPQWQRISVEQLDHWRGVACVENWPNIKLCRGPGKGCHDWQERQACDDCYRIGWYDKRPSAEILAAMERGDG
jgi:hypothetical protein